MKRSLKTLGLVLAAVFAMGAVMASAASAAEFHSAAAPVTLSGSQSTSHVFTTNAGTVTCKVATFSGSSSVKTTSEITMTPKYENCTAFGFISVPIHVKGDYLFTANGDVHVNGTFEITAPGCTTTVSGPQTLKGANSFSNNAGKTDVIAKTNASGIAYNECGTARTNGTYTGTTTVTGTSNVWYE